MNSTPSPSLAFRRDINALRAWAVVAVVGFHFHVPGFASGFVGVDIFFVLSGYLMTGQVLAQLQGKRFSLARFWTSRLRRIFPALLPVLLASIALGWWLSMPGEFLRHTRQMLFATTFASNIPFGDQRGYFDAAAHTKPLLHTWSLAIEWQFYLLLPLLLMAVWRLANKSGERTHRPLLLTLLALAGVTACSLAWCLLVSGADAGAAFFSLRARAWELVAGGLVACLHQRPTAQPGSARPHPVSQVGWRGWLGWAGWGGVVLTAVLPLPAAQWPGTWTVLPVLATALIIGAQPVALLQRALQLAPVQRLGDWSYAIYLWHWLLWVFMQQWASYRGVQVGPGAVAALVAVCVALGYGSYRFVEQPTRARAGAFTPTRLWWGYAAALLGLTAFTLAAVWTHGFPQRVPDYQQRAELARRTNTPRDECFRNARSEKKAPETFCTFGAAPGPAGASAMLWGDSVADQFLEPLTFAAARLNVTGLIATQSGCRALTTAPPGADPAPATFAACERFNRQVLGYVTGHAQPGIIILGRNWGNSEASVLEAFVLVRQLLAAGKTVVLILPMLQLSQDVPELWIRQQFQAGQAVNTLRVAQTPELMFAVAREAIAQQSREFTDNPRLITVDLLPNICAAGYCDLVRGGQANFRDTLHISNLNASQYNGIFAQALDKAVAANAGRSGP